MCWSKKKKRKEKKTLSRWCRPCKYQFGLKDYGNFELRNYESNFNLKNLKVNILSYWIIHPKDFRKKYQGKNSCVSKFRYYLRFPQNNKSYFTDFPWLFPTNMYDKYGGKSCSEWFARITKITSHSPGKFWKYMLFCLPPHSHFM